MKPTITILESLNRNSNKNKDEVFTRLYRYMLRPDIYYVAYKNLYANNGASTKGVNDDTVDGFGEEKIMRIIKLLQNETYKPNPSRRIYIKKSNGKMRPLGIPTFTDKLVQEVLRMILQAIYEPVFLDCSHGFRPNRSCHTALKSITKGFNGVRWFVEGDIKGCFDNINHEKLIEIISNKIKDARIIKLIWKFLKAGYMENWKFNATYSGTPQGGIISPIFANIYLHELDKLVYKLSEDFNSPRKKLCTTDYNRIRSRITRINPKIENATGEERKMLIAQKKELQKQLVTIPCKSQTDKKLKYVRYADDFLIGINGSKDDCLKIKRELSKFISKTLKMELSEEKTLITHSSQSARFLGYDVSVRRSSKIKKSGNHKQRTLNQIVELKIPLNDKIMKFLFLNEIVKQDRDGNIYPNVRKTLLRCSDLEIVSAYNAELRGICNYYTMASNFCDLNYFEYLMKYSCLKTLAHRHKSTVPKIITKFKDGSGNWGIHYETKQGNKRCYFANFRDSKKSNKFSDAIENTTLMYKNSRTLLDDRLSAKICELCGNTTAEHYEVHHVHKIKDLKGKEPWEQIMIAKKRKTMVLCRECHKKIHGKKSSE